MPNSLHVLCMYMTPRTVVHARILRGLSSLSPHKRHYQKVEVGSLSSLFPALITKCRFFSSADSLPQSLCFSGLAQSVISRCSNLLLDWECDKGKSFDHGVACKKDFLLEISDLVPELARRFRRVPELKPRDVLEILLGFESESGRVGFEAKKVECLWGLFKWVNEQHKGFEHLPGSWEVMARVLVRFGLFREAELLLLEMGSRGIRLGCHEILSDLIQGYVSFGDSNRAISMYDRIKCRGLAPSMPCYHVFLRHLVGMRKTQVAFRVCMDMVEIGIGSNETAKVVLNGVIRLLCADGKIQEARNLVRKVMAFGFDVNSLDINGIVYGYCEKRDFDDALSFFREIKCAPNVLAGNRIIHSLCGYSGTKSAHLFMEKLESLGFVPDEITFGVLIGWCCREGKLRSSFVYLTEIFSRGLKPHKNSYNALICGLFLKGMWNNARDVFDEMVEKGLTPDLSTYRVLLAGYCRARQFNEVKKTVSEMETCSPVENVSSEGQLSRAFSVLGFDPLTVKLKRDNYVDFVKSDFVDDLGNGLYLDTDLTEYERKVTHILEDSLVPNYNSLLMKECNERNMKVALTLADEMLHWGQELSFPVFSSLLKGLCSSHNPFQAYAKVLEQNPRLFNMLDQETSNLLVQVYCKRGWTCNGKLVLDNMLRKGVKIDNDTYTAIITGLCKTEKSTDLCSWWDIARIGRWVPRPENSKPLLQCLCNKEMIKEALELLENMLVSNSHLRLDICHLFIEKLSCTNFSRVGRVLLDELVQRGCVVDRLAYSHVMRGLCKEREYLPALKILDGLMAKKLSPSPDVAIVLIPLLCKANRNEEATNLKEISMRDHPFSSLLISNALMKGLCMTTKVGEATSLLQDMLSNGIVPDAETYNILVGVFCKVNNLVKVLELLGLMLRKNFEVSIPSYRNLVRLMCTEGKVSRALKLKELRLGQGKSRDLIVFNVLVFQLFSTGNHSFVNQVLNDLDREKLQLDEVSYNFLVYGFSKCKDVSRALHYVSTMISNDLRPSNRSLRAAITTLCSSKQLEKALALSREMELKGYHHDSIIQDSIAECLLSLGKLQEADSLLERLAEKKLIPAKVNYDNLIKRFCSCGNLNKAIELLNIMLKKSLVPSSTSYDSVIISCCASNNLNKAMDFHTEMLDRNLRPSLGTWNTLVHRFCEEGRAVEAQGLLASMVGIGETPTKEMFKSVIDRYHLENRPRKASEVVEMMQRSGFEPDFETHWSVIGSLRKSFDEADNNATGKKFLSRLLSDSGFFKGNNSNNK